MNYWCVIGLVLMCATACSKQEGPATGDQAGIVEEATPAPEGEALDAVEDSAEADR